MPDESLQKLAHEKILELIRIRALMSYRNGLEMQHVHRAELENTTEPRAKLILLQHTPVYTLGRKTEDSHITCSEDDLHARTNVEVIRNDRGGSITYHGPGQLMGYILLNLQAWNLGIHAHLDMIEEAIIHALKNLGLDTGREEGMTGVWTKGADPKKLCAIGVTAKKWVTYHGFCLNVDLDLAPYKEIIACGLEGKGVTTIANELKRAVTITEMEDVVAKAFAETYGAKLEIGMA